MLTGQQPIAAPTTVSAGTLMVNGSIANSAVTVNTGALLTGTGTVGAATISSGGDLRARPLARHDDASTAISRSSRARFTSCRSIRRSRSSANVITGGSATLAGTVGAAFASGSYVSRSYTILSAAGGLNGTTFNALTTSNLPAGFTAKLSYTRP